MEDHEVIEAFVAGRAVQGFGPQLHIEGDCLILGGWWHAAFRVGAETFAVRDEAPPEDSAALDDVAARLGTAGLQEVPAQVSLMIAITYTAIDLGFVEWALWSTDTETADADLHTRAGADSFLGGPPAFGVGTSEAGFAAGIGGLRRTAGLAPMVILMVGLDEAAATAMAAALGTFHVEARDFSEITAEGCGSLTPTLVVVDATSVDGELFLVAVRSTIYGRDLPLVALSDHPVTSADATLDPAGDPAAWAAHIGGLLP